MTFPAATTDEMSLSCPWPTVALVRKTAIPSQTRLFGSLFMAFFSLPYCSQCHRYRAPSASCNSGRLRHRSNQCLTNLEQLVALSVSRGLGAEGPSRKIEQRTIEGNRG